MTAFRDYLAAPERFEPMFAPPRTRANAAPN